MLAFLLMLTSLAFGQAEGLLEKASNQDLSEEARMEGNYGRAR